MHIQSTLASFVAMTTMGAIALVAQVPAQAQDADYVDPLEGFQTDDNGSEVFGAGGADSSDVFDLIHRMTLSNGTSMEDFTRQRGENITTEAQTFREIQMQRIQRQQNGGVQVETEEDLISE